VRGLDLSLSPEEVGELDRVSAAVYDG